MRPHRVLFLCTGNSARSILAEYLLRDLGRGRFETYSAGAAPKGVVHPMTQRVLAEFFQLPAADARSKSWDEFRGQPMDFVITVCDHARESCPVWPGQPVIAHWGSPDPAAFVGDEEATFREFKRVGLEIRRRLELFCALPFTSLDGLCLIEAVRAIPGQPVTTPAS